MNQRPSNSRVKDPRKEKFVRSRRDEEDRLRRDDQIPRRSSSERSLPSLPIAPHIRLKDHGEKSRSSSRDGYTSLIFRRQERGRIATCHSKGTTPENSPGRIPHSDPMKSEVTNRLNGGTGNAVGFSSIRESKEFGSKLSAVDISQDSDDIRLLKLLQRLEREDDRERQLLTLKQLKEYFIQPENVRQLAMNLNTIISTFEDLLHQRLHMEMKQEFTACLGTLGAVLGLESKCLFEWIFSTYNMSITDDARILLLRTLHEALKCDKDSSKLTELMTMIMTSIQSALENADLPDLLVAIVDVIMEISSTHPSIFSNHFRDTVDILVGWHIDSTQSPTLTQYTSKALISFQQFWITDINFSITLLGQFLEDMEAYAEDLVQTKSTGGGYGDGHSDDQAPGPDECLAKITCLIKVFTTVLKSLGNHISPNENPSVKWDFLIALLKNFLKCVMMSLEYPYQDSLVIAANECICLLLSHTQSRCVEATDQLMAYVNIVQSRTPPFMTESYILSVLQLMSSFVQEVNTQLPLEFITTMFSQSSLCQQLRFSPSNKIQQELLDLQHGVLGVKNVPVLEEVYKCILVDIQAAYTIILGTEFQPFAEYQDRSVKFTSQKAEMALLSSLCALAEIGNAKHSIIGMWALKPSFFDLMTCHLQPTSKFLSTVYPAVQYSVLYTLHSHCLRHGHFISSSSLVSRSASGFLPTANGNSNSNCSQNSPILSSVSVVPPPSSSHLSKILILLATLLKQKETPYDSRLLCIHWIHEIVENLHHQIPRLVTTNEFSEMIDAVIGNAFMNDPPTCTASCSVIQTLLKCAASNIPEYMLQKCYEVCVMKLTDHNVEVRDSFSTALSMLPLNIVTSGIPVAVAKLGSFHHDSKEDTCSLYDGTTTLYDIWTARHGYMSRTSSSCFQSHNFRTIMAFILQGIQPKGKEWLVRLFFSCHSSDRQSKIDKLMMKLADRNSSVLWFWATWEIAQNCVLNKLRTPLGKPQETFMSIEAAIKSYAKQAGKQDSLKSSVKGECEYDLLRVYLMLDLMEHLEKLMYNAYEGCAVALPTPPKTVRTFFRTNKGTCQEWLSRVRMANLVVALRSGQKAVAVRHGYQLLQEMKDSNNAQGAEFEHALTYIVEALIGLRCPDAILGLYTWCKEQLGRKFTWIKASVDQAAGRYETAAHEYLCILRSVTNQSNFHITSDDFSKTHSSKEDSSLDVLDSNAPFKMEDDDEDDDEESENCGGGGDDDEEDEEDEEEEEEEEEEDEGEETTAVKLFGQLDIADIPSTKSETDPHLNSFFLNQLTEIYRNLGCWSEAVKWIDMQQKIRWNQNGLTRTVFSESDLTYLKALSVFEDNIKYSGGGNKYQFDLKEVNFQGISMKDDNLSWEIEPQLHNVEKSLLSAVLNYETKSKPALEEIRSIGEQMKKAGNKVLSLMKITALDWPLYVDAVQASLYLSAVSLASVFHKGRKMSPTLLHENVKLDPPDYCIGTLNNSLMWNNVWLHLSSKEQGIRPHSGSNVELQLVTARLARKQQNLRLAQKLLLRNANFVGGLNNSTASHYVHCALSSQVAETSNLFKVLKYFTELLPAEKTVKLQREGAKLLYSSGDSEGAIDILLSTSFSIINKLNCSQSDLQNFRISDASSLKELNSRCLLNLVKYLQQDSKQLSEMFSDQQDDIISKNCATSKVLQTLHKLTEIEQSNSLNCKLSSDELKQAEFDLHPDGIMNESDFIIGRLLQLSVNHCPSLAKSWVTLASWCYRWGRKAVDTASDGCIDLLPEEESHVLSLLPQGTNEEEKSCFLHIISHIHGSAEGEWNDHGLASGDEAEVTRRQLLVGCPSLQNIPHDESIIDQLVDIWKRVVKRAYSFYELAATSYFKYLQLNGQYVVEEKSEDDNVTATLRLLRLVVKHASELRDVLEHGLAKTPTAPWRGIIPQLFSRLNHPEPYVRQSISDLLCRVAQASPHLIVFPAVVGSLTLQAGPGLQEETSGFFAAYFSEDIEETATISELDQPTIQSPDQSDLPPTMSSILSDEEESEEEQQKTAIMQNCFAALVETLGRQDARTIAEVKNLVHELRRITLLWDELWLGTLNLHHSEVNRRITTLEEEIKKVQNNVSLNKEVKNEIIKEKHNVFMKPTLYILEQLQAISGQPPETPHEQWFQDTFGKPVQDTLKKLNNPVDPERPQQSWMLFKQLHQMLQQRIQQQARSHLFMDQISPVLAALKCTVIPMPGINIKSSNVVTIESVHNNVSILPTKTKPKKLAFFGSDGRKYTYLFKGLEDLHLDERIMQFLSIVNNMFAKNKRQGKVVYNARHYSVTPLGPRSGLIQWVDGATPLFGLYKRWQQREAMAQALKTVNVVGSIGPAALLRPSEIYYNKLTPLLKEKGITNLENRKEWPLSVLLEVLKELMAEIPKDLLAKELWCSCSSALEWWEVTQTYNYSTAVMSMIGYIIGLGDRHLDNVLVDLTTGEVVHIDYNVCFEKGKNLRVPEKVPFRMTPNIETALGVTGVEGIFRVSCEHVLKVLRKGRETLLTLLEAFVYDPLVDWTPGSEGGYTGAVYGGRQAWATESKQTKQEMEREIACSMFAIRVAEMKSDWGKNRDELVAALPKLEHLLKSWLEAQLDLQAAEILLQEACQEKALLEEAQTIPNHSLYTLPKRFEECAVVRGTVKSAKEAVKEKLSECKKWQTLHMGALKSVCGPELGKWCAEVSTTNHLDTLSVAPVVEFLQSAGQGQLVQQCEHAESELGAILQQQKIALRSCVELLTTYATIVVQYPLSFKEENRSFKWQQWLENLLVDFTVGKCQEIIANFHAKYGMESMDVSLMQAAIGIHFQLQSLIGEINTKLMNVLERQQLEGLHDAESLSTFVEEAKKNINHFVKENGDQGRISLLCVVMTALCALNKRLLMMESAASAAGDCLVDLTSWGGDWFLDEIYSMSNNITQFFRILQELPTKDENSDLKSAFHAVNSAYGVFAALEDLSLNFQNIILPEALKTAHSEEPSVLDMYRKLNKIIDDAGIPLDKLVVELEASMRNIIMEIETQESEALQAVQTLKSNFDQLMKGTEPEIADLSPGQMLLMGFNGLFTKLESDMSAFLSALDNLSPPSTWRKVDVVREAAALTPPICLSSTRTILCEIFFLKRLQTMQQFYALCQEFACRLQIPSCSKTLERDVPLSTDEQLFKPVKMFIAEYVRKQVLGLASQTVAYALCTVITTLGINVSAEIELRDIGAESKVSLEELSKKAVDMSMKHEKFQTGQLTQASTLTSNFDADWRKEDLARRLDQTVLLMKASLQRAQLQLARYQWLNEDLLVQGNIGPLQNLAVPARASVMSEMRKTVQALLSLESAIAMSHERYLSFTASIEQRLKWAAGANPSLTSTQEEFEAAIAEKSSTISAANQTSRELVSVCNSVLHFEALRTRTSEALSSDSTFLSLINRCQESCVLAANCNSQVSTVEEHLIALKPLPEKGGITQEWISSVMEKVSQSLTTCKEKLEEKKNNSYACWETVKNHVVAIRSLLSTHHRLMSDVRHILRTLAKHEEQDLGIECKTEGRVHSYITLYKTFSEKISSVVREILNEGQELETTYVENIIMEINPLVNSTEEVYNKLLSLAGPLGSRRHSRAWSESGKKQGKQVCSNIESEFKGVEQSKRNLTLSTQTQELFCVASPISQGAPQKQLSAGGHRKTSVMRDPRTGKVIQERNSYATSVWRRVKMKLDGRDPDCNKRSTIAEQVDFVIKEATNMENLAVLYEGWTPWV